MFSMTIAFEGSTVPWTLLFKTQEALDVAIIHYQNPSQFNLSVDITDDYGQRVCIKHSSVKGVMFEDMSQSKLAHIERGLHQTRMQIEANNLGRADPSIANAMRESRGQAAPSILSPFGPNGAFRQ